METQINNTKGEKLILMGEDDKFISKIYQIKLEKEGYRIEQATNGEGVLRLAREKNPDLILLDLIMPVKDGFETLKELKADPELKDVKVVVISNLSQEEDKKRVIEMGAVDYIVKAKASFIEILDLIKKHLGT